MILSITVGSILRFINTIGSAHSFAIGNYLLGGILAGIVIGSAYLENKESGVEEDEEDV